jgi:DNA helicase HerA-like ATPase
MRITNPIDQNRIAESVESVGRDLLRELPSLSKGQVVVSGASVNTPVLLKVRKRITQHGGQDLDAPAEWMRWFEQDRPAQEERADALYVEKKVNYEDDGDVLWA